MSIWPILDLHITVRIIIIKNVMDYAPGLLRLSPCLTKHYAIKIYGRVEVLLQAFLSYIEVMVSFTPRPF